MPADGIRHAKTACGVIMRKQSAHRDVAAWLHLAAKPVFSAMAVVTALTGDPMDMLCNGTHGISYFSGMPLMYALMGIVHAAPWFTRISRACSGLRNMMPRGRM